MEIEAPPHAVAIWLEGERIMVRFPDRQLVAYETLPQLMITLRHRAAPKARHTVGTAAAPVQYDINTVALALHSGAKVNGHEPAEWDQLVRDAGAKRRANVETKKQRRLKKDAEDQLMKSYMEDLALAGL